MKGACMKKFLAFFLVLLLIIAQTGCKTQENNTGISKTGFYLDTICQITIYSMEGVENMTEEEQKQEALLVITDAFKLCNQYENLLSKTIEDSDIYNINHANGQRVEVSDETIEVIQKGIEYGNLSNGAFDITIGKVTDIWDFRSENDEGEKVGVVPEASVIQEAVSHVDYNTIIIDGNYVSLTDSQAEIDLGGIAKGYIADKVAAFLQSRGVTSAIVDLGGNIVTIGEKGSTISDGNGSPFVIGIADPYSDIRDILGTIQCENKTIVTSGTYERYFEVDGIKYHHVLDADTGYPKDTDLLSVSIITDIGSSVDGDALSTTCLVLGMEDGIALVNSIDGVEAIFVGTDGSVVTTNDNMGFVMNSI
jgi:thiamine biosynthesis lipoprotein